MQSEQRSHEWLVGGGQLGAAIRSIDWSSTSLGHRDHWSDALRTALNLVLASQVPMALIWGPDAILLYNDAFRDLAIDEPSALGRSMSTAWPPDMQTIVASVLQRGESAVLERLPLPFELHGSPQVAEVTFAVSPVRGGDGGVAGALITLHVNDRPAAEDVMHEIFDSSFGFIGLLSVEGILLKANRTALDFIGASWTEVANRPFWDTPWWSHSSEMRELCRTAVRRAAGGEFVRFEVTHPARDGIIHYVDFTISPVKDAAGNVVQLIPEGRDVTDRRRAEELQKDTDSQFQVLSDLPTEGIMIHVNGIVVAANRAFGDFIALPPQALIGKNAFEVIPLTPASRQLVKERSRSRYEAPYEVELFDKDGGTIYAETRGHDVAYRGTTARMVSMRDITERKRAELALRTSEAQLRANLEATPNVAVQWYDENGYVLYWNTASENLYGWTRAEAVGKPVGELMLTPEETAKFHQVLKQVRDTGEPVGPYECHVRRRDGSSEWVLTTTFSIPLGKHQTGYVCMDVDITERRQAEQAVLESDRRKSEFIAMLSHELRNPLAAISNSLFILEQTASGAPAVRHALDVIGRQVSHLTRLIDDLLDVTRITRGKIELRLERIDINEIVRRAADDHRAVCAAHGIELAATPAPDPVWVDGDATRLAQAIDNLIQNAVKFTPRTGRIMIDLNADVANGEAVLSVRDTGVGIAPEMMPRLFQPFVQGDSALDRSKGGLGLGLAVVQGLVELHGGSVTATSEGIDAGATFALHLPLALSATATTPSPTPARGADASRRVLVIEDNLDAADSLRDAFELMGHTVDVAYDGPGGIECARAVHPDVVFCDIGLPGMDGYDVARTLRADPEMSPVMLVALSGYATKEDIERAKDAGFHAHLAKPASIETLQQVLTERTDAPT